MDIFKKKSLCAALAGFGALGVAGAAQAVNLNSDGLGQVLIYPYYTTRTDTAGNAYNSLLSVVNSTASVKSVKVRFLEGKDSREVLDFNLFLSPNDVWTGAITASGAGGAMITTADNSCTLPAIPKPGGQAFVNFAYTGGATDGGDQTLDRTREGYVEIIEMATYSAGSTTATNVTHVNSVPPGCAAETDALASAEALPPGGGLMGGMTLINVDSGTDYTEDAVALANFSTVELYANAGSVSPQLTDAFPPISLVVTNGNVYQSTWGGGSANSVSAVLMHETVLNEFVLDSGTHSGTDWVLTMPTKRFYVSPGTGPASGGLFQSNFSNAGGGTSCDDVSLNIFDREENTTSTPLNFSPPPPSQTNSLCWEANVVTFNGSNVLGSTNSASVPTGFQDGWLDLGFFPSTITGTTHELVNFGSTVITPIGGTATSANTVTYDGLPVIGFSVNSFTNGAVTVNGASVLSNYGGNFIHKYTTDVHL